MESQEDPLTKPPILVAIVGPVAVGKMTVGQELSRLTGWPLYFNHRILDLVTDFFPGGSEAFFRLVRAFNTEFYEAAGGHGLRFINTWGWRFDVPAEAEEVIKYVSPILAAGGQVYVAELTATLAVRLERNRTENRQRHKKTAWATDALLIEMDANERWNSGGTLPVDLPHLVLDTVDRSPHEAALAIYQHFKLAGR